MRSKVVGLVSILGLIGLVLAGPNTNRGTQPVVAYPLINSTTCRNCHGYDFQPQSFHEPGDTWAGTMMANSARDPIFWAALDVANHDAPAIGDWCLRCHAPGAWLAGRSEPPGGSTDGCGLIGDLDDPFAADFDGVSCHLCHRMMVNPAPPPGELPSYLENGQLWIDDGDCDGQGQPCRRGPYEYLDGEPEPPHPHQFSSYHLGSNFCGSCHNVTSPVRNLIVNGVDQGIRFPLERTHKEWVQSDYAIPGPSLASCQSCHMPESGVKNAYACAFFSNDRTGNLPVHRFAGGNTWVPVVLRQAYPSLNLGVEFRETEETARDMLQNHSADVAILVPAQGVAGTPLSVQVRVTNRTGHKLPTGYAEGRRMWLQVEARDGNGVKFWESGAYDPVTGVLVQDPAIKIYRAEQGVWNMNGESSCDVDDGNGPTFHFARNDCVALDNRIPPLGFRGGNDLETRSVGYAYPETAPGSGTLVNFDVTGYSIPVPTEAASPVSVTAALLYQTTSKEYVEFLRDEAVAHDFPDDCIERSTGPALQSRAEILYDMWVAYGRAAPVEMGRSSGAAVLASPTPGEASGSVPMQVTAHDRSTGNVTISFDPACDSTDHTVYAGSLSGMSTTTFSQQFCGRGTTGSTTFSLAGGSYFWVIVGNDGLREGSFGTSSGGVERAEDTALPSCNIPQDLSLRCDP